MKLRILLKVQVIIYSLFKPFFRWNSAASCTSEFLHNINFSPPQLTSSSTFCRTFLPTAPFSPLAIHRTLLNSATFNLQTFPSALFSPAKGFNLSATRPPFLPSSARHGTTSETAPFSPNTVHRTAALVAFSSLLLCAHAIATTARRRCSDFPPSRLVTATTSRRAIRKSSPRIPPAIDGATLLIAPSGVGGRPRTTGTAATLNDGDSSRPDLRWPAATNGAFPVRSPSAPLTIDGTALLVAPSSVGSRSAARKPSAFRFHGNLPRPGLGSATARKVAGAKRGPTTPFAVHFAAVAVAAPRFRARPHTLFSAATRRCRCRAVTSLNSAAATGRARTPACPCAPFAVHRAALERATFGILAGSGARGSTATGRSGQPGPGLGCSAASGRTRAEISPLRPSDENVCFNFFKVCCNLFVFTNSNDNSVEQYYG